MTGAAAAPAASAVPPAAQPTPLLVRALVAAIVGAIAGAAAFVALYGWSPAFVAILDTPITPSIARGLHPSEFERGGLSFAWTEGRVTLIFEGLDRSRPWTLQLRAKAGRGGGLPAPTAAIGVDGTPLTTAPIGPQWQDIRATLPTETRTRPTRITVDIAPTFVPGPGDARTLGVMLDEVRLVPNGWPAAPRRAVTAAASAGAIVAALVVVAGVPVEWAFALVVGFALAQALALTTGAAPYVRGYLGGVPTIAGGAGLLAGLVAGVAALVRRPLSAEAGIATSLAAIALVLGLEGLLHPGKAFVDAVFHAHKLDSVLAGHYFFTQPMPSGVEFPYAIGLYVTAAPWAGLTRDHVLLLRVVVVIAHVLAALSLYPVVRRHWPNPGGAAVAVGAYLLAPLPFVVIGNANQTYAFGQSIATIALASAMSWPLGWRRRNRRGGTNRRRRAGRDPVARPAVARRVDPPPRRSGRGLRRAARLARQRRRLAGRLGDPRGHGHRDGSRGRALLPALRRRVPVGAESRPGRRSGGAGQHDARLGRGPAERSPFGLASQRFRRERPGRRRRDVASAAGGTRGRSGGRRIRRADAAARAGRPAPAAGANRARPRHADGGGLADRVRRGGRGVGDGASRAPLRALHR